MNMFTRIFIMTAVLSMAIDSQADAQPDSQPTMDDGMVITPATAPLYPEELKPFLNMPTKKKPDWEKIEEPAMRPYKAVFRGVHALCYNVVKGFEEGNSKLAGTGSAEAFRGLRVGTVELLQSSYVGMAGSKVPNYKTIGKPNQFINDDLLLRNVTDAAAAGAAGVAANWYGADSIWRGFAHTAGYGWTAQKITDRSPVDPNKKERELEQEDRVRRAREQYIGARARTNEKSDYTGNILLKIK